MFLLMSVITIAVFFAFKYFSKTSFLVEKKSKIVKQSVDEEAFKSIIDNVANLTIKSLKFRNFNILSSMVHPKKGVRFSFSPYISSNDIVIKKTKLIKEYDQSKYLKWGVDNEDNKVILSLKEYWGEYVYNKDYVNSDLIFYNRNIKREKNVIDTVRRYYSNAIIVEYFLNNGHKEWYSLKLAFEKYKNNWFLTGIVNLRGKLLANQETALK